MTTTIYSRRVLCHCGRHVESTEACPDCGRAPGRHEDIEASVVHDWAKPVKRRNR